MTVYEVSVPFVSLKYEEDPSTSRTTQLPSHFGLPAMNVAMESPGIYRAVLHVEASNATLVKEIAVDRVEEFLALQAAWNDGFRVRLRGVKATPSRDESVSAVERIEGERTIRVQVADSVSV